ncbi:hypothetical protein ABEB36_006872 [Hypothenemus hampei]|uniref:Regulatory protein zeste n=1 Tax=Hypothenemus hampei TaxID=57062 RepID=A0ABD1ES00_HYPHA
MAADNRKFRKPNFTEKELNVLATTVMQHHHILYGDPTKGVFRKEIKDQVWNSVLSKVNKVSTEKRTLTEIKNKWKRCQPVPKTGFGLKKIVLARSEDLDTMPLQQRLSQSQGEPSHLTPNQESLLQTLPLSPTKLKVTRQSKPTSSSMVAPMPQSSQVCLKWNSHHNNMQTSFPNLLLKEQYVDVTLVADGKTLKCHRMILSSCSPYFETVLEGITPLQHPVLFMKDIPFWILKALCDFMYAGEVHISQDKLPELLKAAAILKIKGLGTTTMAEDPKKDTSEIKKESETNKSENLIKQETSNQVPMILKPTKPELGRPAKRKDEKKLIYTTQPSKPGDDTSKRIPTKIIAKFDLPTMQKVGSQSRFILRSVVGTKSSPTQMTYVRKPDLHTQKSSEKSLTQDNIIDPLDLLEPVYEEFAKDDPPFVVRNTNSKLRDKSGASARKSMTRKVRKRRYTEYSDEEEETSSPVFQSRKGTRSRPNVKVPKYFDTENERSKESSEATIVREPHTDQGDPLVPMVEIKTEPVDLDEGAIEIEDNLVNYNAQDQTHDEEIIGNYDSPLVNQCKPKVPQPLILDVHTVAEPNAKSTAPVESTTSQLIISNVQSMAELLDEPSPKENEDVNDREQSKNDDYPDSTSRIHVAIGVRSLDELKAPKDISEHDEKVNEDLTKTEETPSNYMMENNGNVDETTHESNEHSSGRLGSLGSVESKIERIEIKSVETLSQSTMDILSENVISKEEEVPNTDEQELDKELSEQSKHFDINSIKGSESEECISRESSDLIKAVDNNEFETILKNSFEGNCEMPEVVETTQQEQMENSETNSEILNFQSNEGELEKHSKEVEDALIPEGCSKNTGDSDVTLEAIVKDLSESLNNKEDAP